MSAIAYSILSGLFLLSCLLSSQFTTDSYVFTIVMITPQIPTAHAMTRHPVDYQAYPSAPIFINPCFFKCDELGLRRSLIKSYQVRVGLIDGLHERIGYALVNHHIVVGNCFPFGRA